MKEKFNLICKNKECKAILAVELEVDNDEFKRDDLKEMLDIYCPCCGQQNPLKGSTAPVMVKYVDALTQKGYTVMKTIPKFLGIILKKNELNYDQLQSLKLPYEFIIDTSSPENDLIVNDRLQDMDHGFEGFTDEQKAEYLVNAGKELDEFIQRLPVVTDNTPSECNFSIKFNI